MDKEIIFRVKHKSLGYASTKYPQYYFGYSDFGITKNCFTKKGKGKLFTFKNILRNGYSSSMMYSLLNNFDVSVEFLVGKMEKTEMIKLLKEKRDRYRKRIGYGRL